MGVPAGRSVLCRRSVAQGRVTVSVVVFVFEVADHDAGLEQRVPVVSVEALLPKSVVERFDVAVVPWSARCDVGESDPSFAEPLQRLGNQFRPLSIRNTFGGPRGGENRFELYDETFSGDRALH